MITISQCVDSTTMSTKLQYSQLLLSVPT